MPNNQFAINRDSSSHPWAMRLANLRDQLTRWLRDLDEVRGKMIACYTNPLDGNSPDYANLESQFGLTTGEGQACFAELDSMAGAIGLPATAPSGTINRADVYAALKQFCDQIG